MDWLKVVKKAFKAGVISGLAGAGVSQDVSVALGTALVGAVFGAIENWFKHRSE